jgi:dTDP-4-amino-4,6-dideoxygalactose transaminase
MAGPAFIPQASPLSQYVAHREAVDAAIQRVLDKGRYILGDEVEAFEREFADYIGVGHGVGVASGTDAIEIALRAGDIGMGDEVITTAHTAVATVAAIERAGAVPVLVDIEPGSFLIDAERVGGAVTVRTRAIVAVHLYGQPADLIPLREVAGKHGLRLIEDCAQAHGALYQGKRVGCWGDAACFSFYPTKNLGAIGDGGLIATNDSALAQRARVLREYGWRERFRSEEAGMNSRLDELQAAVLRAKLPCLDADNQKRAALARQYSDGLPGSVEIPLVKPARTHVFHQFVIRTPGRDALQRRLAEYAIGTAVHYPVPIHLQPAYRGRLGKPDSFPAAEQAAKEILSLPLYPELDAEGCRRVIGAVRESSPGAL